MQPPRKTICYVAAHSGGHIIPCLTLAEKDLASNSDILFFCSSKALDQDIITHANIPATIISLPLLQSGWRSPFFFLGLLYSFVKSFFVLLAHMPEKMVTTGGIVAIPVCYAGYLLGIPIELFELNAQPGKAIAHLAPLAHCIKHVFKDTCLFFPKQQCKLTPYPVRFSKKAPQKLQNYSFSNDRITLFVQGGSQGSLTVNNMLKELIKKSSKKVQVIHQAGKQTNEMKRYYRQHAVPAVVFDFDPHLENHYQSSDLVICRSGAGALFETIYFKKPCITIPLITSTNNHQLHNAQNARKQYPSLIHVAQSSEEVHKSFILAAKQIAK